ncbi:hypothetical protein [Thioalkalivibrio sp.]
MIARRDKILLSISAAVQFGILLPLATLAGFLWQESVVAEQPPVSGQAQRTQPGRQRRWSPPAHPRPEPSSTPVI